MTTTQAVSIPVRYQFQAITYEGKDREVNSTRALIFDRIQDAPPAKGEPIDFGDACPWPIGVGSRLWEIDHASFLVDCETGDIPEEVTAEEVETAMKRIGFREDVLYACHMDLLTDPENRGLSHAEICRMRDEQLELLGLTPEPAVQASKDGWQAVQFHVFELVYEECEVVGRIPPMRLDTLMPCLPSPGDTIRVSDDVGELFGVHSVADRGRVATLLSIPRVEDPRQTTDALRAAGFVDID